MSDIKTKIAECDRANALHESGFSILRYCKNCPLDSVRANRVPCSVMEHIGRKIGYIANSSPVEVDYDKY